MYMNMLLLLLSLLSSQVISQDLQCHVPGECSGLFNGFTLEESYNNCLLTCKSIATCNWFNFNEDNQACIEYSDCLPIDNTTCSSCFTGQQECSSEEDTCNVQGFCDGHIVSYNTTSSVEECVRLCQQFDDCHWYSYFSESKFCFLTEECTFLDESCSDCITGERECYDDLSFGQLLVIGDNINSYKVEVIDLTDELITCPQLGNYPIAEFGSVGTFIDGNPMLCGGYFGGLATDACSTYDHSVDVWRQTEKMLDSRHRAAAVQISPTKWWITGGQDGPILESTEMYTVGEGFTPYVDLPDIRYCHNLVQINSTHTMLLSGCESSNKVWMFEHVSQQWIEMSDLLEERGATHAGLVTYPDGRKAVVVAGGYSNTAEIFDLDDETWRFGPNLPVAYLSSAGSVQYGDSFLIVSGDSEDTDNARSIYQFNPEIEEWLELPQRLAIERHYVLCRYSCAQQLHFVQLIVENNCYIM